jgi:hypothetical protein
MQGPATGVPVSRVHKIPEENAFIAQHRANLPAATFVAQPAQGTHQGRGRGVRGSGTAGRGRGAATAGRGRGARGVAPAGRGGRGASARTARGTSTRARGQGRTKKTTKTRGMEWLLFGEGSSRNAQADEQEQTEFQSTQGAPATPPADEE